MKKIFLLTASTVITLIFAAIASADPLGEALVVLRREPGARSALELDSAAASIASRCGASNAKVFSALTEIEGEIFAHFVSETMTTDELIAALEKDGDVISASPNSIVRATAVPSPEPSRWSDQWNMIDIKMPEAWDMEQGKDSIYVAVVDTGVSSTHPDLAGRVDTSLGANFTKKEQAIAGEDDNGHGTHVAGIIAASGKTVAGVNVGGVRVIAMKVLDASGTGSMSNVIAAVDRIAELVRAGTKIRAANFSLLQYDPRTPEEYKSTVAWRAFSALDRSPNAPVLVIAAGNEKIEVGSPLPSGIRDSHGAIVGEAGDFGYPASMTDIDGLIVVAATKSDGNAMDWSCWSSRAVHISAPGEKILSTYPESVGNSYNSMSGTSMAAPHVSGAAALLAAKHPEMTAVQIKDRLLKTAEFEHRPDAPAGSPEARFAADKKLSAYGALRVDRALDDSFSPTSAKALSIKVSFDSSFVFAGSSSSAYAAISPSNADGDIVWSSSNESVAAVDARSGAITAKSEGSAVIRAKMADDETVVGSATITVTARAPISSGGGGGCSAGAAIIAALFVARLARRRRFLV